VILKFEGNHALVKADVQDKKVFINVSGHVAGRRPEGIERVVGEIRKRPGRFV
jgi:hypothetical protein